MDLSKWKAQVQARLRESTTLLQKAAPGMAYGALATCTLLPLLAAHQGFDMAASQALSQIFGGIGMNLFSQQIGTWLGKQDEEVAELLGAKVAADPEWRAAFDELIERMETPKLAQAVLAEADWVRLEKLLARDVQALGSTITITYTGDTITGTAEAGARNVAIGKDIIQNNYDQYIANQEIWNYTTDPSQPDPTVLHRQYLRSILKRENRLLLEGVREGTNDDGQLELSAVYTALLTMTPEEHERWSIGERPDQREQKLSAVALLDRHQHLVLLGDPGGGKSTFVKFVALCMAGELLEDDKINLRRLTTPLPDEQGETESDAQQPWGHAALLPLPVVLRDFAAEALSTVTGSGSAADLLNFIEHTLEKRGLVEFVPYLRQTLYQGKCLLLLDGLDEVPDANQQREQLKAAVTDFIDTYPDCRILVTSRTYAYQRPEWRLRDFAVAVLAPFSIGQIRWFIDQWYQQEATSRFLDQADIKGRAEVLKRAILENPRLYELAERPLLLTLMATLHAQNRGQLPERRVELYEASVHLLLNQWERRLIINKGPNGEEYTLEPSLSVWLKADRDEIRRLINQLAYEVHEQQETPQGTADVPEADLVVGLYRLSKNQAVDREQIIQYLSDRAGILIHRAEGIYSFPHRTFQEYLAACHLNFKADDMKEIADTICKDPNRWREVALLAAAQRREIRYSFWGYIEAFCHKDPNKYTYMLEDEWGALLAGRMLVETIDTEKISELNIPDQNRIATVGAGLVHILTGTTLPALERAEAGRTLAKLGDTRAEVLYTEQMAFCYVPAGPFIMGSDPKEDEMAQENEQPQHELNISYDYWIGRYPVTNAQYDEFVADGGYADQTYWAIAIAHGYWQEGAFKGEWDSEPRTRPNQYGEPYHLPNHPVVGISWYEALAFCHWLTAKKLPEGWQAYLPSEAEWEKAARGGLQIPQSPLIRGLADVPMEVPAIALQDNPQPKRRYPWGHEIDPECCSYDGTNLGSTSAVGAFSAGTGPYGVEELSGSVWEWTRSVWYQTEDQPFKYPYKFDDGRENLNSGNRKLRVWRGGAFVYGGYAARAACRYWVSPHGRYDSLGVRLVCCPHSIGNLSLSPPDSDLPGLCTVRR